MAPTRDAYLPGVPCWIDLRQPDPQAAKAFYGGLFGWEFTDEPYAIASIEGSAVAAIAPGDGPWNMYVAVEDIAAAEAKIEAAGGRRTGDTEDVQVGYLAAFEDSLGARFLLWQANGFHGAQLVNAPGTWNFSGLEVADQDAAAAFYRAVFGWEPTQLPGAPSRFFALAGYGDFLAKDDPEMRERQASSPTGFENAVAWIGPGDDARWTTTFGVADCDASTARAMELGATVLGGPSNSPYVRTALIRDPQGAELTLSQYKPEG